METYPPASAQYFDRQWEILNRQLSTAARESSYVLRSDEREGHLRYWRRAMSLLHRIRAWASQISRHDLDASGSKLMCLESYFRKITEVNVEGRSTYFHQRGYETFLKRSDQILKMWKGEKLPVRRLTYSKEDTLRAKQSVYSMYRCTIGNYVVPETWKDIVSLAKEDEALDYRWLRWAVHNAALAIVEGDTVKIDDLREVRRRVTRDLQSQGFNIYAVDTCVALHLDFGHKIDPSDLIDYLGAHRSICSAKDLEIVHSAMHSLIRRNPGWYTQYPKLKCSMNSRPSYPHNEVFHCISHFQTLAALESHQQKGT